MKKLILLITIPFLLSSCGASLRYSEYFDDPVYDTGERVYYDSQNQISQQEPNKAINAQNNQVFKNVIIRMNDSDTLLVTDGNYIVLDTLESFEELLTKFDTPFYVIDMESLDNDITSERTSFDYLYNPWNSPWRFSSYSWYSSWYNPWYSSWYTPWSSYWYYGWYNPWYSPWYTPWYYSWYPSWYYPYSWHGGYGYGYSWPIGGPNHQPKDVYYGKRVPDSSRPNYFGGASSGGSYTRRIYSPQINSTSVRKSSGQVETNASSTSNSRTSYTRSSSSSSNSNSSVTRSNVQSSTSRGSYNSGSSSSSGSSSGGSSSRSSGGSSTRR